MITINKVLVANCIMTVYLLLGLYADTVINRRKNSFLWMCLHILGAIAYYLLGAKSGFYGSLWAMSKFALVIFVLHRGEEKYVLKPIEGVLLGSPYLIIGILNWQEGFLAVLNSLCSFFNNCQSIAKKDITKNRVGYITNFGHTFYSLSVLDFTGGLSCLCSAAIQMTNVLRIKKNGEDAYYRRNVVYDNKIQDTKKISKNDRR